MERENALVKREKLAEDIVRELADHVTVVKTKEALLCDIEECISLCYTAIEECISKEVRDDNLVAFRLCLFNIIVKKVGNESREYEVKRWLEICLQHERQIEGGGLWV